MLSLAVALIVTLAVVSGRADSTVRLGAPSTLVSLRVPIVAFAQDGGTLAWMTGACRDYYGAKVDEVATQSVSGGRPRVLAKVCGKHAQPDEQPGIALSGSQVLFWWPVEGGNHTYHEFATARIGDSRALDLKNAVGVGPEPASLYSAGGGGGPLVRFLAGSYAANDCYSSGGPCLFESDGLAQRLDGGKFVNVPGTPIPAAADASGSAIAVVAAAAQWGDQLQDEAARRGGSPPARLDAPVQILDARTGTLIKAFKPSGRVREVAISGSSVAVLVDDARAQYAVRIELFDTKSGRLLERAQVPASASDIDVEGAVVVYRVDSTIQTLTAGRTAVVAQASAIPVGLSIVGHRIAWAEARRIRSVTLPVRSAAGTPAHAS